MRWVIGLVLSATLLVGCADDGPSRVVLTEADNTSEVHVDSGDELEVRLESNPTTGYRWEISPGLPDALELHTIDFEAPDTDLVGAPGEEVFVFGVTDSGAGILRLEYIRPFEELPVAEQIVEFIVIVDNVDNAPWPPP